MDLAHQLDRNLQLLGRLEQLIIAQGDNVADLLLDLAHVTHGLNDVARARLAFGADHRAPSATRRSASPRSRAPQTNGTSNWVLSMW